MTDRELATALSGVTNLTAQVREHWSQAVLSGDDEERRLALDALRHVTAVRHAFEGWIAARAVRAADESLDGAAPIAQENSL